MVAQLKATLLGDVPKSNEVDPKAYELFLEGRHFARLGSAESYERAMERLEQAVAIDADYAAAWDGMASVYINQSGRTRPRAEGYELARKAANKALAIDPDWAPAHGRLGWITLRYDGDLRAATRHFQRALELAPSNIALLSNSTSLLYELGRSNEAIAIREYCAERDPLNPESHYNLSVEYWSAKRWEEAIAASREALRLSPDKIGPHFIIAYSLLMMGDAESALAEFELVKFDSYRVIGRATCLRVLGRQEESDEKLREFIDHWGDQDPGSVAGFYAHFGDVERAFEWLDKLQETEGARPLEPYDFNYDSLRDDPRWIKLLEKIGRSPAQLEAIEFEVKVPRSGV